MPLGSILNSRSGLVLRKNISFVVLYPPTLFFLHVLQMVKMSLYQSPGSDFNLLFDLSICNVLSLDTPETNMELVTQRLARECCSNIPRRVILDAFTRGQFCTVDDLWRVHTH